MPNSSFALFTTVLSPIWLMKEIKKKSSLECGKKRFTLNHYILDYNFFYINNVEYGFLIRLQV